MSDLVLKFIGKKKTLIEAKGEDASIANYRQLPPPDRRVDSGFILN